MAQEAALQEKASSSLRRLLAFHKSFTCTDEQIGETAPFSKAQNKKSTPQWRGPALILDIDETGVTVKLQSQVFKVARFCVRMREERKDAEEAGPDLVRVRFHQSGYDLGVQLGQIDVGKDMESDRDDGNSTLCTGTPESGSGPRPGMLPASDPRPCQSSCDPT